MSYLQQFLDFWRVNKQRNETRFPNWIQGTGLAHNYGELTAEVSYRGSVARYEQSDIVYSCIKMLSTMASDARLLLYPLDGEFDPLTGQPEKDSHYDFDRHPFYELWESPNPENSRSEFMEMLITTYLLSPKGVFVHLDDGERATGRVGISKEPAAMWWLIPEFIQEIKAGNERLVDEFIYEVAGQKTVFDREAVLWIKDFHPMSQYSSLSRLGPANIASASDVAAQTADYALFKNGLRYSAVLESEKDFVSPDDIRLLERYVKDKYTGGPEKWHQLMVLWAGFKVSQNSMTPADAQTDEASKRNLKRILRVFGIHPGLMESEDVNLANAKVAEHVTRKHTLRPLLTRVADEITDNVLPFYDLPAKARFVNVVPQDEELEAMVEKTKAETHATQAQAVALLAQTFGLQTAVEVATEWGILPEGVSVEQEIIPQLNGAGQRYYPVKQIGTIAPALPPIPLDLGRRPSEREINRMLAKFYDVFPEYTGLLE